MSGTVTQQFTIEAEITVPAAAVRLARISFDDETEGWLCQDDGFWVDMCVTTRTPNARLCFDDHWAKHRFEAPGRVFVLPPGESLRARSDRGSSTSVICILARDIFKRWLDCDFEWTERRLEASLDLQAEQIQNLLRRLGDEVCQPGFASEALCEAMAIQLAVELNRYYLPIDDGLALGGLAAWRMRRVTERLEEVRSSPTLSELADLCGLSIRQLTRGFRASRGCSIGEFIAHTRIETAKKALVAGESVKEISFSMGFGSSSSFCQAFRRRTGHSPQQYRMQASGLRRGRGLH